MNTSLDSRVLQIFSDVLGSDVQLDSTPETVETWDSLQHLTLVLAFEQEFSVEFAPDEIETLLSPAKVAEVIAVKLGEHRG
jgi:acyl carrier protein